MDDKILASFNIETYKRLLSLLSINYTFKPVSKIAESGLSSCFLRHDIDFFLDGVLELAELERCFGIQATYYIPLSQPFNVMFHKNRYILNRLTELGHEIGLHYDLSTYPNNPVDGLVQIEMEALLLERISGQQIRTITMHQPHTGCPDPFIDGTRFINPRSESVSCNIVYISDSCRAWRDNTLLECFGDNRPERLLLLIHPELWMKGEIVGRIDYLRDFLFIKASEHIKSYLFEEVKTVWLTHPGPKLHDMRIEGRDINGK